VLARTPTTRAVERYMLWAMSRRTRNKTGDYGWMALDFLLEDKTSLYIAMPSLPCATATKYTKGGAAAPTVSINIHTCANTKSRGMNIPGLKHGSLFPSSSMLIFSSPKMYRARKRNAKVSAHLDLLY
jgi:hypothetical protein